MEFKLKSQDKYLKEVAEDVTLKSRSLEWVIGERNVERDSNTDLRVRAQNLAIDLNIINKKLEDANRKLTDLQNKISGLQIENSRHLDTIKAHESKIDKLTKVIGLHKLELRQKDDDRNIVEMQMAKAIKRFSVISSKPRPVQLVSKYRPKSSKERGKVAKTLARGNSMTLIRSYIETEFIENYWKNKLDTVERQELPEGKRLRRLSHVKDKAQHSDNEDSFEADGNKLKEKRRYRTHTTDSPNEDEDLGDLGASTPRRHDARSSLLHDRDLSKQADSTSIKSQGQRRLSKLEADSSETSHTSSLRRGSKAVPTKEDPQRRHSSLAAVRRPSTTQTSQGLKREELKSVHQSTEDRPWASRIETVPENIHEENEGLIYGSRSIESVTTNSSNEDIVERVVMNAQGRLVTYLSKKVDTIPLLYMLAEESSKSMQFNCEDPDMEYDQDGTARTSEGESRFYLPFNPNTVFGLRGDVFYHSLFQVFQSTSKTADSTALYTPPYKLQGRESPIPPRTSPTKRTHIRPPHTACGGNCKHLNREVRPKAREDMILPLKKQDIGL